ncbi:hypothetical protein A2U01_0114351, partial [Trifolium medium]|nr:hypothetical protein [Trifolium medium]
MRSAARTTWKEVKWTVLAPTIEAEVLAEEAFKETAVRILVMAACK